jgi:TonB family protein
LSPILSANILLPVTCAWSKFFVWSLIGVLPSLAQSGLPAVPPRIQVPAKEMADLIVSKEAPVYPPLARLARIQGTVILKAVIGTNGDVGDIQLISGHPMLAPAAIDAVRQWKYEPYILNGTATEVETQIQVNFALRAVPSPGVSDRREAPDDDSPPSEPKGSKEALVILWVTPDAPKEEEQQASQRVLLRVFVSQMGTVDNAEIISGDPVLGIAAVTAAKKWEFRRFIRAGEAIPVATIVPFRFGARPPPQEDPASNSDNEQLFAGNSGLPIVPLRVRVAEGVMIGLLTYRSQPVYPPEAKAAGIQGSVTLRAWISKEGRVTELRRISGPRELAPAAKEAAQQWRYRPFILMGEPADVETKIQMNFVLNR